MGFVYMLTSPSKKRYIGITTKDDVEERWNNHLKKNSHCTLLKRAIDKYGFDSFKKEVLVKINNQFLQSYEKKFINVYNTLAPNGYNCTTGGELNKKLSEETKQKISKTTKQTWANKPTSNGSIEFRGSRYYARYGKTRKRIGTYETYELAQKAIKQWKETGTIQQEGLFIRNNGCICKRGRKFVAMKNCKYLGTFDTREYAQKAIDDYVKSL